MMPHRRQEMEEQRQDWERQLQRIASHRISHPKGTNAVPTPRQFALRGSTSRGSSGVLDGQDERGCCPCASRQLHRQKFIRPSDQSTQTPSRTS